MDKKSLEKLASMQAHKAVKQMQPSPSPLSEAEIVLQPIANAALSITRLRFPPQELQTNVQVVVEEMIAQTRLVQKGDISKMEELLYTQALTLDATFHKFLAQAALASGQTSLLTHQFELITGLAAVALKAQDQSRKTLVALAELKSPRRSATFIKSYVAKQLNQLNVEPDQPNLEQKQGSSQPLELQEDTRAAMDIRGERKTIANDTAVETLVEVHRSGNSRGSSNKRTKRL